MAKNGNVLDKFGVIVEKKGNTLDNFGNVLAQFGNTKTIKSRIFGLKISISPKIPQNFHPKQSKTHFRSPPQAVFHKTNVLLHCIVDRLNARSRGVETDLFFRKIERCN